MHDSIATHHTPRLERRDEPAARADLHSHMNFPVQKDLRRKTKRCDPNLPKHDFGVLEAQPGATNRVFAISEVFASWEQGGSLGNRVGSVRWPGAAVLAHPLDGPDGPVLAPASLESSCADFSASLAAGLHPPREHGARCSHQ